MQCLYLEYFSAACTAMKLFEHIGLKILKLSWMARVEMY